MGKLPVFLPFLVAFLALACASSAPPTPVATPTPTQAPKPAPSATSANADIKDFTHQNLAVKVGATVVWTNRDSVSHTTTDKGGKWDSGVLPNGQSFTFVATEPGAYNYFCAIHTTMTATVTVTR